MGIFLGSFSQRNRTPKGFVKRALRAEVYFEHDESGNREL